MSKMTQMESILEPVSDKLVNYTGQVVDGIEMYYIESTRYHFVLSCVCRGNSGIGERWAMQVRNKAGKSPKIIGGIYMNKIESLYAITDLIEQGLTPQ